MFNVNDLISRVVGASGGAAVKRVIGLRGYDWVDEYLRDQEIREEIASCQAGIDAAQKSLIDKSEIRKGLEGRIKKVNDFRLLQLAEHLKDVQRRECGFFNELHLDGKKIAGSTFAPYLIEIPSKTLDALVESLPEGVPAVQIAKKVAELQKRIAELEKKIAAEVSPKSRWVFNSKGDPEPYPGGCRWRTFFRVWSGVARRFSGPVNIEGYKPADSAEFEAYLRLGLNEVAKIPPLREPL
jgi:hypothetical protein